MSKRLYYRTICLTDVIRMTFYEDALCQNEVAISLVSNFLDKQMKLSTLDDWYPNDNIRIDDKSKNMIWLDRFEVTKGRMNGYFRQIVELTLTKIRKLNVDDNAIICLEACSMDEQFGPSTKKLVSIYREFGFRLAKRKTSNKIASYVMYKNI